jgi:indolepyruvate ferredoxin oxidoreductase alpha subunit
MGASIGTAGGVSKVTGRDAVAIVGDSTFFHAAIPGLINAVYNNHKLTLIILDNLTTAMTGHQPHPGTGVTGMGFEGVKVSLEEVAKGCGVKYVRVVSPFDVKGASSMVKEALKINGPSVIIFRSPCTLMTLSERRRKGLKATPCVINEKCTGCMVCFKLLGCPALEVREGKAAINANQCSGCTLCAAVCPYHAIEGGEVA